MVPVYTLLHQHQHLNQAGELNKTHGQLFAAAGWYRPQPRI